MWWFVIGGLAAYLLALGILLALMSGRQAPFDDGGEE